MADGFFVVVVLEADEAGLGAFGGVGPGGDDLVVDRDGVVVAAANDFVLRGEFLQTDKIADSGNVPTSSVTASRLENFSSGYTGARCANDFATSSPGWLSESTAFSSTNGCAAIRRSSSPAT